MSRLGRSAVVTLTALAVLLAVLSWSQWTTRQQAQAALAASTPSAVDIGFAQSMSLHHQQAVQMAQMMTQSDSTAIAGLARNIIGTQLLELGEMRGWLRLWNQSFLPPETSMSWMLLGDEPPGPALRQYLLDCEASPTGMPGLATPQELAALNALQGVERDRRFLELMQAHHEGGLPMAQFAARHARIHAVRRVAATIVLEQSREIAGIRIMLKMLESVRPDHPPPG
ncbi:MAG: DUF305 domain-containing protein [Abyssibacter sp.]|uniref:DUF305 domain-containing protein n=1 Tax=Abyssibacter sp. TaxID=2320200 RepID=UPI00321ADD92